MTEQQTPTTPAAGNLNGTPPPAAEEREDLSAVLRQATLVARAVEEIDTRLITIQVEVAVCIGLCLLACVLAARLRPSS